MELSDKDKVMLLSAARKSILSIFKVNPPSDRFHSDQLKKRRGAFVTLRIDKNLRGCIGYLNSEFSLYETVINAAKQSAIKDPRFLPLTFEEFNQVDIEISVLSSFVHINDYDEIKIGLHGLFLNMEKFSGVLLPQVAVDNKLSLPQYLTAICEKAGLHSNFWQINKLNLLAFEADVFSEIEMKIISYDKV